MNNYLLSDAISSIDDDIVQNYFLMKEKLSNRAKITRFTISNRVITMVACFALMLISVFMIYKMNEQSSEFELPVNADEISWYQGQGTDSDEIDTLLEWNGLNVSKTLNTALQNAKESDYLAIHVRIMDEMKINDFVYNGKSYKEYSFELEELNNLLVKLEALLKDGEYLKYGALLYTEGTPDGEKWSYELYGQTVEYYGKAVLEQYIVQGEFLADKVIYDMENTKNRISSIYQALEATRNAYNEQIADNMATQFKNSGYIVNVRGGSLFLFVTKENFAKLNVENVQNYAFYHASYNEYNKAESD